MTEPIHRSDNKWQVTQILKALGSGEANSETSLMMAFGKVHGAR